MSIPRHTPGPWLRVGNMIYVLMHHGWRKGIEQFRNRLYVYVQADEECPDEEYEANIQLMSASPELLAAQTMGAHMNTPDFLDWIAERLVNVYGVSPNVDFVLSLTERAKAGRAAITKATESKP